jgi:hypothetical protein
VFGTRKFSESPRGAERAVWRPSKLSRCIACRVEIIYVDGCFVWNRLLKRCILKAKVCAGNCERFFSYKQARVDFPNIRSRKSIGFN